MLQYNETAGNASPEVKKGLGLLSMKHEIFAEQKRHAKVFSPVRAIDAKRFCRGMPEKRDLFSARKKARASKYLHGKPFDYQLD